MSIVKLAVKRPVAIAMFTVAVLLFGMVSLGRLSVNLLPELSYPTLTIRTDYNGAAPNEVEQLVSKPVEEAVGVVKGVKSVKSVSRPGQSDVVLEFAWGTDMDFASLEVREKLDILQLPLDVEKPRLLKFNPSMDPVMKLGLSLAPDFTENTGENSVAELKRLRLYAEEQIKRRLESIEGVASVRLGGGLENEILVAVDHRKASQVNVEISDVITRLQEENVNTAGGRIDAGTEAFLVRTLNEFESLRDIENVYIRQFEGRNVQLKDVATVSNFFKDRDAITRFNGVEGTEIAIYKEGDANSVDVAQRVIERLNEINTSLPAHYDLETIYNQSIFIKQAIDDVKVSALVGGLLAMLVIYLFLRNFWTTLIISISIPVSVIATFNLMYGNDISLNIMSLGGIALAVGLLVDNSIVVLENIDRHKRERGENNAQAAENGTREVAGAIVASTLTTMAVFVPLIFVEGIAGQLFSDQAMTVSFALAASLVVALTVIPSLAARSKKSELAHADVFEKTKRRPTTVLGWAATVLGFPFKLMFVYMPAALITLVIGTWAILAKICGFVFRPMSLGVSALFVRLQRGYDSIIKMALRQRILVLVVTILVTGASILLVPKLGMELIPKLSQGEFFVEVTLPSGTRVERTDNLLAELAKVTNSQPDVQRTYSLAGTGSLLSAAPSQGGDHWGKLNVVMQPGAPSEAINAVKEKMRVFLRSQAGVQSQFGEPALFSFSAPLQIQLQGYDLSQLRLYSQQIISELETNKRFADITSTLQAGNPELKIRFNNAKLARLNLDAKQIADTVSAQIGGSVATQYSIDDRKVDILVRSKTQQRDNVADVSAIIINPQSEFPLPLGAVADIYMSTGPSEITRVSQQRVVLIEANLAFGDLADAVADADTAIAAVTLPLSMKVAVAGQREDMDESFRSLQFALALAVFMVYLVMASQFESLLHPLLILFAVPLAGAGSVFGLWLTNTHVSVVVFIGLIMLCGIVVNNAIVLIDRINQLRTQGMDKSPAIIEAAKSRLRPIVMTTLTTILGLLPMAIGFGDGAEVRTPMAITVIFGLLFATLLTLVVLPVLYSVFDNKRFARESTATISTGQGENHYG